MTSGTFNTLHRTFCIFLLALCSLSLCLSQLPITAIAAEPLRVVYGFDREFPPFSYEEAGGQAVGFEVELVKAIFNGPDIVLQIRPLSWENVALELSSGAINVTSGMVRTEQRSRLFLFSKEPSFPLEIALFTKIYNRIPSSTMARGLAVSVEQGTYQHRLLENFKGVSIKTYPKKLDALKALYNDEVNAFCAPVQNTYYYINKLNYGAITTVGTPIGLTEMRLAVNKGRGDILRLIDKRLGELKASGEYDLIYRKWFVREMQNEEIPLLHQAASKATITAYIPYSNKGQGAALLTTTGKIYTGCTLENAKPDLSITALQGALAKAVADGEYEFQAALLVDAAGTIQEFSPDDLQNLYEFGRGILCITTDANKQVLTHMVAEKLKKPVSKLIQYSETE